MCVRVRVCGGVQVFTEGEPNTVGIAARGKSGHKSIKELRGTLENAFTPVHIHVHTKTLICIYISD